MVVTHIHEGEQHFALVGRNEFPCRIVAVVPRIDDAVEVTVVNEVVILVVVRNLLLDNFDVLFGQVVRVKFVAEGTPHCHVALGFETGTAAHGNVCAHRGCRVAHGSTELDRDTFDRVGVVGRPDLGRIVQHCGVETSAAAGTVFKKDVRKVAGQAIHDFVGTENEAVENFFAVFLAEQSASGFGNVAVEVPLDVVDLVVGENFLHLTVDVFADIRTGHIDHVLLTCDGAVASGNMDAPVGMRTIKVGVRRDHFGFVPDTELETEGIHTVNQHTETARKLVFVDIPVTERAVVGISDAEPAVVHNEHFDADFLGTFREGNELVGVKAEVSCFPAVDEKRTLFGLPAAADEVVVIETVENTGHFADPFAGEDENRFGSLEFFARFEVPGESVRVDTDVHAGAFVVVHVSGNVKVAAVNEVEAENFALIFVSTVTDKRRERIVEMRRRTAGRRKRSMTVFERRTCHIAFGIVAAVEMNDVKVHRIEGNARTVNLFDIHRLVGFVDDANRLGHRAVIFEYGVHENRRRVGYLITDVDFESFAFVVVVRIGRRHCLEFGLALVDLVADITEVGAVVAVGIADRNGSLAEVTDAEA